jgi:hypothetical protein
MHAIESLTSLEIEATRLLLAGNDPILGRLRQQLDHIIGVKRKFTGGGFYTTFELTSDAPALQGAPALEIGDVSGSVDDLPNGAQFVLYVASGKLHMLKGAVIGWEKWPSDVKSFKLGYGNGQRDRAALNRILATARQSDV